MIEITDRHKNIYNMFSRSYRSNNNKPYRAKKDFTKIAADAMIMTQLERLRVMFDKYPAFEGNIFFDAPYKLYKDNNAYVPLKYYVSHKGVDTCIAYTKLLRAGDPMQQLDFIRESYRFIAKFCISKRITLEEYVRFCSVAQNDCLLHLKTYKICWFVIFGVPGFYDLIYDLPNDEFSLYFGSMDLNGLLRRYKSSNEAQQYLTRINNTVSKGVKKHLHNEKTHP